MTCAPALYEATVRHVRVEPVRNAFYDTYYWLVDLDDPPRPPRPLRALAGFRAADHAVPDDGAPAGADGGTAALRAYLARHGVDLRGGRILMLAHARVLGHVFNPLTVYWCYARDGGPVRVVAEVHNTYGRRHRYLLDVDEWGRAETGKTMYVSPFNAVDGRYRLSLPEPGERLALTVALHREGGLPFTASVHGVRHPATTGSLLRRALRHPLAPLVGALRIRRQGVGLHLRGLPVRPDTHIPAPNRKASTRS
ncbi:MULTISPECIES: DUF1365 domain-containing protein [unclassified Nocardiopsis]|uniref:DUF1365 domain-containing protein n=1 Tax=unclassified Nocardiopsis TaxID=2649073 RepID=UPI001F3B6814|nr:MULTISPECIES: DUF1365 domain-containing protein [unclassified Nocardiopsis]